MDVRNRAKSRYYLVSQVSIKNAPSEVLVCVRSDNQAEWAQFLANNEECGIAVTHRPVGPIYAVSKLHETYTKGLADDRKAREALAGLSKDELVELALRNGLCVATPEASVSNDLRPVEPVEYFKYAKV
jgi:predicted lactoylglutathione lyase